MKLAEVHLEKAKKIAIQNRKKSNCKICFGRGHVGTTLENTLVLCHKCVDMEKALSGWKNYVKEIPELKEQYSELFEEETKNV